MNLEDALAAQKQWMAPLTTRLIVGDRECFLPFIDYSADDPVINTRYLDPKRTLRYTCKTPNERRDRAMAHLPHEIRRDRRRAVMALGVMHRPHDKFALQLQLDGIPLTLICEAHPFDKETGLRFVLDQEVATFSAGQDLVVYSHDPAVARQMTIMCQHALATLAALAFEMIWLEKKCDPVLHDAVLLDEKDSLEPLKRHPHERRGCLVIPQDRPPHRREPTAVNGERREDALGDGLAYIVISEERMRDRRPSGAPVNDIVAGGVWNLFAELENLQIRENLSCSARHRILVLLLMQQAPDEKLHAQVFDRNSIYLPDASPDDGSMLATVSIPAPTDELWKHPDRTALQL